MFRLFKTKDLFTTCSGRLATFCTSHLDINDILATHLGFDHDTIQKVNEKYNNSINRIPKQQLVHNCRILQKSQVDLENIQFLMFCLQLDPMIVNNRILLLEEMGVKKVSLAHIYRFPSSMRGSIRKFKNDHDIPNEQNIIENMFNSVGVTSSLPDIKRFRGHVKTSDCYMASMTYYKTCHLKLYYKPLLEILSLRYQSFRQLTKLLHILENDIQLSKKFLCKHRYLLTLCPDDINNFLTKLQDFKLDGKDIRAIIQMYPRILTANADNIKELLVLFNGLQIPEHSVVSNMSILKIDKETVLERYMTILNSPELNLWLKHPKIVYLIVFYNMVMRRTQYLRCVNRLDNANIHTFSSSRNFFLRFAHGGVSRQATKKFLRFVLCNEIGPEKAYLIDYLIRHPHWKNIALFSVQHLIKYLKKHYSIEDICENIHIVLYPKSAVIKTLEMLSKEYSQEKGHNFTPSQYLALCLYTLEKVNHFSGDAVWQVMYTDGNENSSIKALGDIDVEGFQDVMRYVNMDNKAVESISEWKNAK